MCDACKASEDRSKTVTPQMMEEFRQLFEDWRQSNLNQDALEVGGTGDLEVLARRALGWALAAGRPDCSGPETKKPV